jgi:hypothetical protein
MISIDKQYSIDLIVAGKRYDTRRWTCVPRVGDYIITDQFIDGGASKKVLKVKRVVWAEDNDYAGFIQLICAFTKEVVAK